MRQKERDITFSTDFNWRENRHSVTKGCLEVGQLTWQLKTFDTLHFFITKGKSMRFPTIILLAFILGFKHS